MPVPSQLPHPFQPEFLYTLSGFPGISIGRSPDFTYTAHLSLLLKHNECTKNLASSNDHYKLNFTKFALLNIPTQVVVPNDQTKGKLNFDKSKTGPNFFNFQPGDNSDRPTLFGDQLVESLRNYVTNYDTTLRESRINSNTDFYNINEMTTPTEMIFFKWCK